MPNDVLVKYVASSTLTLSGINGLASDLNRLVGIESSAVDNRTVGYEDYIVGGFFTTGTSPVDLRFIDLWAVAWNGNAWPSVFLGSSGSRTIPTTGIRSIVCRPVISIPTDTTSNRKYDFSGISIKQVFRGVVPAQFSFFISQNTNVALNSTLANHELRIQGVYPQIQ